MASKTILELSATTAPLASDDLIVIEKGDGSGTKKMTYTELINAISNEMVAKSALVNAGTQTASGYALDARYGKTLWDTSRKVVGATAITENANLNSFTTPGEYYCGSNATAATISNSPTTSAFRLTVEYTTTPTGTANVRQTVRPYNSDVTYIRYTNTATSNPITWFPWYTSDSIIPFHLGDSATASFTMKNNFAIIAVERDANYQLLFLDYWSGNPVTVATSGTTLLTVTKSNQSYDVTIKNNRTSQTVGFIINPASDLRIQ